MSVFDPVKPRSYHEFIVGMIVLGITFAIMTTVLVGVFRKSDIPPGWMNVLSILLGALPGLLKDYINMGRQREARENGGNDKV